MLIEKLRLVRLVAKVHAPSGPAQARCCCLASTFSRQLFYVQPIDILAVIHSISEDKTVTPIHNLTQIGRIAKGLAPSVSALKALLRDLENTKLRLKIADFEKTQSTECQAEVMAAD